MDEKLSHWHVKAPDENRINDTIMALRQHMPQVKVEKEVTNLSIYQQAFLELSHTWKRLIFSQILILCIGLAMVFSGNVDGFLEMLFSLSPLVLMVGLWHGVQISRHRMTELEMTFRYAANQLFLARFMVASLIHILCIAPVLIASSMQGAEFLWQSILSWLIPSVFLSAIFLVLTTLLPQHWSVAPAIMTGWMVVSFSFIIKNEMFQNFIYQTSNLVFISLIIVSFLSLCGGLLLVKRGITYAFEHTITDEIV